VDNKHVANPLAGMIHCALCGYSMIRRNNPHGVFLCCKNTTCSNSSTYLDIVLSLVLDTLQSWVRRYEGQPLPPVSAPQDHSAELAVASSALAAAQKQLSTAKDMLERGVYSVEEFLERRTLLNDKIAAAQSEIERLQSLSEDQPLSEEAQIIQALPAIRRFLDAWPYATTPAEQNALLRSIISRIDYSKPHRLNRNNDPRDSITLKITLLL
jgi:hypothetical protein